MQCPFCDYCEDKVVDSRLSKEGQVIRRRRECLNCKRRYTTYERVEQVFPMVIKKDGRREMFDRQKIVIGLKKACEKRPVSVDLLDSVVLQMEKKIGEMAGSEVESRAIGEEVMRQLHKIDQVAYVRFASVYSEFKDLNQFMTELKSLLEGQPLSKEAKRVIEKVVQEAPG